MIITFSNLTRNALIGLFKTIAIHFVGIEFPNYWHIFMAITQGLEDVDEYKLLVIPCKFEYG